MIGRKTPRGIVVAASAVHRHPCRNANFVRAAIIGFNALLSCRDKIMQAWLAMNEAKAEPRIARSPEIRA